MLVGRKVEEGYGGKDQMDALEMLEQNAFGREGSFIYDLHEENIFALDKLKIYFDCLFQLASEKSALPLERKTSWMVMKTYSYIIRKLMWHHDPNDFCIIEELPNYMQLAEYLNDLEIVVQSYFDGEGLPDRNAFSL